MSLIQNPRVECGEILQNRNGQYFFVCSTCKLEFVTLSSFLSHQNDGHEDNELRNQSNDLTVPFTKKRPKMQSDDLTVSVSKQTDEKIRAGLRTASQCEPRRTILISPRPEKTTRKIGFAPSFGNNGTSSGGGRKISFKSSANRVRAIEQDSGKYRCKNCCATFSTMVNLDSHELVCMMLPMRFCCDRCNKPFDDKIRLQIHKRLCN
ncbi:uncharacterized protein LOC119075157 [Bradysia coprophila]|uniref:uncharacterized protein LOC119075157 n=1 Tax=Bradysia coprophila TaxID=38358 RepID=UPI00187D95E2|nr:uncharacterized protein LOC119075157 [Bradysia coprophila]